MCYVDFQIQSFLYLASCGCGTVESLWYNAVHNENYAPTKFSCSFSDTLVGESLMYVQEKIFSKDQRVISLYMIFELPGVHRCVWEIEKRLFI